ncbi:hypothetical protein E4U14_004482 [Claviceps sp. LM454 group G7]|nr:hypothetical protein E4U14_004482 [Claviceps sp. LM454 group G7]
MNTSSFFSSDYSASADQGVKEDFTRRRDLKASDICRRWRLNRTLVWDDSDEGQPPKVERSRRNSSIEIRIEEGSEGMRPRTNAAPVAKV